MEVTVFFAISTLQKVFILTKRTLFAIKRKFYLRMSDNFRIFAHFFIVYARKGERMC